jgi:Na+/proline symporter
MNGVLFGIFAYILAQLAIGALLTRRVATEEDYLLAGRGLGLGLGTFTVFATWFGAETCIGAAGMVYGDGLSGGSSDPFGYSLCLFLMGLFFAVPLWRRRLTTLADLFRQRYSPGVEKFIALLLAPTSIIWAGAQIRAFGQVIAVSSGMEVDVAISLAAGLIVLYTVYGGMYAEVVTDLMQGIALIAGLGLLTYWVLEANGGLAVTFAALPAGKLDPFGGDSVWRILETWAIPVTGSLFAQELVARILASRTPAVAQGACLLGGSLYLAVGLLPVFMGLAGANLVPGLENPEQILPRLALAHLPDWGYALFAGALLSAILSTVDRALLAASALTAHNVVAPLLKDRLTEKGKLRLARGAVIVYGAIAWTLARTSEGVHDLVEDASAFGGAGVFVVALFALFGNFGGAKSAMNCLLASAGAWLAGEYLFHSTAPYLLSLAVSLAVYPATALRERRSRQLEEIRP